MRLKVYFSSPSSCSPAVVKATLLFFWKASFSLRIPRGCFGVSGTTAESWGVASTSLWSGSFGVLSFPSTDGVREPLVDLRQTINRTKSINVILYLKKKGDERVRFINSPKLSSTLKRSLKKLKWSNYLSLTQELSAYNLLLTHNHIDHRREIHKDDSSWINCKPNNNSLTLWYCSPLFPWNSVVSSFWTYSFSR